MAREQTSNRWLRVEGIERVARGSKRAARELQNVVRDIMRGPFGDALRDDIRARVSDNSRTGYTASRVEKGNGNLGGGYDSVEVGLLEDSKHPHSSRANVRSIGIWLESGTRPHYIPRRAARPMLIGGRIVRTRFVHPGTRAYKPVGKTLNVFRWEAIELIVRELDRRLGPATEATRTGM